MAFLAFFRLSLRRAIGPRCQDWPFARRGGLAVLLLAATSINAAAQMAGATTPEFDCLIEPQQTVKLASPVVGVIARLDVDRGDVVHKGQVVGKLEDGVEEATLALARARASNEYSTKAIEERLAFFRRKSGRAGELLGKNIVTPASADEAETDAKVAEQQRKEAQLNLEIARLDVRHSEEVLKQRTLRSPVDGVVVERLLVPGEYRNEQTPILTLAQMDPLRVEVFVPTIHYGLIQMGSKASVRPEAPIGGLYSATVTVIDRVLDAASGTFGVRLELPNSDLRLPAGVRCKILFGVETSGEGARQ